MSGSAGGNRIPRAVVEKTTQEYIDKVLSKFPGFKQAKITGSYNTGTKQDFGDIDLIVQLEGTDKKAIKQDLTKYFASLPDSVIVPFKSDKYKGKKSLSSGELVTILYPISGYEDQYVQIDNIVSISEEESTFKNTFLDYPAEIQGLLLGLAKVVTLEEDPKSIFKRLGIKNIPELGPNQEYEFNLSSAGLTLRIVTLDNFKELDRTEVWKSSDWNTTKKLFSNYKIDSDFKTLLQDLSSKLKNERSKNRIKGIFKSMVSIKSGEVGTPKGDNKQIALDSVDKLLENKLFKGLVRELVAPLLELEDKKVVALYGGGFKPPHKGHFEVVEQALAKYPQIDEFIIYIGSGTRDGIAQAESLLVWDIYKKYLPLKVKIEPSNSPIKAIYDYIENHQDEDIIWVIGAREGKDDDFVDIASRTKGVGKYNNVELAPIVTTLDTSGTEARQALKKGQEAFNAFIPDKVKEKTEIFNTLSTIVTEQLESNSNINNHILELTKYMVNQGMNIKPLPKVKFIHNDEENAKNILGKTAYYNPSDKSITLFTMNRHPKDVLRSFAHEMIHHEQNLDGRLNNISTTNTNEDGALPEIEKEAYQKGNMMLRNWEDSIKEGSLVSSTPAPTPKGQFLQNSDIKIK